MGQPSNVTTDYATLGKIGAVHGVKGWVKLISFTDPAENILKFTHFYLSPQSVSGSQTAEHSFEQVEIDECRIQGKHFIGHIKGCDDRDKARLFTGCDLKVDRTSLPEPGKAEYYWYQLEGLTVINLQNEVLGTIHHLVETGANDVMVISATDDSIDEEERLIPFLREQVIKQVDMDLQILRVDWEKDY